MLTEDEIRAIVFIQEWEEVIQKYECTPNTYYAHEAWDAVMSFKENIEAMIGKRLMMEYILATTSRLRKKDHDDKDASG